MRYSFDPAKCASNLKKHAFDLADARKVIESGADAIRDAGPLGNTLVVVVTTETEDHIRIISMRKADRYEQSIYRENLT